MSKFQIILTSIFVLCIIAGVILFATYRNAEDSNALPPVTIWGTFPESLVTKVVNELNNTRATPIRVTYVQMSPTSFDRDFIEALARGQGPDAILVSQDLLARHIDKLIPIPNNILTERDFKNTYIPQAELYFTQNKEILALPFTIDPMVMYWNRDIFTNAGIANPPRFWDEFGATLIPKITLKDSNNNIRRSAISMGEFVNITSARELLGALFMQAGNPLSAYGDATSGGELVSTIGDGQFNGTQSSSAAVSFFTQFANPKDKNYSWNRSLPLAKSWFLAGNLATYFGFASELLDLRAKNPNIDFDVAAFPQARNGSTRTTYGSMYGFSIVLSTPNPSATYTVLSTLTSIDALALLGKASFLPPVRRDMIATGSTDPYQAIFYDSALISRGWLDTNSQRTSQIFQKMVESITSGRADMYSAIQTAHGEFELSLQNP